jgi:ubiquinone/menaquinone biosynthesis C-methylase UbiE
MSNNRYLYIIEQLKTLNVFNGVVVDCGCGEGVGSYFLKENGFSNVHSFDISSKMIDKCKDYGVEAQYGDITNLSLNDDFADIFICSETLEHINIVETHRATNEIKRICKNNGYICITVPENENQCFSSKSHKQFLSKSCLIENFKGLEIVFDGIFCKKPNRCNLVMIFKNKK